MVSTWEPVVVTADDTRMVGVPARRSRKKKLAVVVPARTVTPVTGAPPQPAVVWNVFPVEVDCSVSGVSLPRLDALPNVSCNCTVTIAEQAPAFRVWGGVRKA